MASPQGFLDIQQVDTPPDADDEPGLSDIVASVLPHVSQAPEAVRFGSFPILPGVPVKLLDRDPSRTRVQVGISAVQTGVTVSTLAYVSDAPLDGGVGNLRFMAGVQLPVINSGSDYLVICSTSELWVVAPSTATNPVYVSFIAESYANA